MPHQPLDVRGQLTAVARFVQPAGDGVVHDVDRPARTRRHHRHPAREGLLGGLAVGLVPAGVHEDVEGGVRPGELVAVQHAQERRLRQQRPQPRLLRPTPDQHQPHSGHPVDVREQLELLLRRQPPDVPDEHLAAGCELGVQRLVAPGGREEDLVHPARPAGDVVDPEPGELVDARRRRGEGAVDAEVDPARQRLHRASAAGYRVALGEPDQVGLVDRHGGDAERACRPRGLVAEGGR
ncbi:hypothetical protein GCM10011376_19860 [Nocardioides flavus (ex Wang et al. 2016)]|uniref:Uncharacterized protein n=1 Tax=Nocardioides flavus (ex Wang et al. 2016) TaxID=2058780 RepID=A0ABQ3HJC2_9ACTN|nr:hypothetical protein GCM10011376_19860 [Nocardioides flavus (ex Wang et al. 2016)]